MRGLFDAPLTRADQIFERFCKFHRANPDAWRLFCKFTDEMRYHQSKWSARAVLHRMRWESALSTAGDSVFKISDHFSVYYARMYLATHPKERIRKLKVFFN